MLHNTIGITVYNMFTAGNAETITQTLNGALYVPDTSNCYSDFAGTLCTYDQKVALTWGSPEADRYGPELVTNGDFSDGGTTGWSAPYQSTISNSSGSLRVTATGSNPYGRQYVTTAIGALYAFTATVTERSLTTGNIAVSLGSETGLAKEQYLNTGNLIVGQKVTLWLTATTPTLNIQLVGNSLTVGDYFAFDNISVREVVGFAAWQATSTNQPYLRSGNYSDLPFVSGTGETWTTTRTMIDAAGGIEWDGANAYWRNSAGTAGNYASTPDSAAASITGDLTLIVKAEFPDWTPATLGRLTSKYAATPTGEYLLTLLIGGTIRLSWYVAGVAKSVISTAAVGAVDGSACWIKAIRIIGVKVQFYKSTDYDPDTGVGTWSQIGADVANTDAAATDTTNSVLLGALTASESMAGKIHYAAAWANTTGTGTPAWEFYPARDAVKPASSWLDFDGTNDYLISSIIPGNYDEGFVCAGAVQTEALGGYNNIIGSSGSNAVHGVVAGITNTGKAFASRYDGTTGTTVTGNETLAQNAPFEITYSYATASASIRLNSETASTSGTTRNYTGTTQYTLIGVTNNAESGVTPSNYLQGHIHALAWLPVIPTEAQETAIRSYIAGKAGVTL